MTEPQLLFLFSSNIRPLYEQDVLDVLAAPSGAVYRFRYENRWIEPDSRERWLNLGTDTEVLVHYSLQQRARYHEPILIPIRRGGIRQTFAEGGTLFVEFALGDYVTLPEPVRTDDGVLDMAAEARRYTDYLAEKDVPRPYSSSAGLGFDVLRDSASPLDLTADQVAAFERLTKYLNPTDSFRDARFYRFLRLSARDDDTELMPGTDGVIEVEGGRTYTLELFHYQPAEVTTASSFSVSVDGSIIQIIGRAGFDVGSRYDRIPIPLVAVQSERYESRETVLVVEPDAGVHGPELRLPIRVQPPTKKLVAGTFLSAAALVLVGSASLFPIATGWKVLMIVVAVAVVSILSFFGLFVSALGALKIPSLGGGSAPQASGSESGPPGGAPTTTA